MIAMVHGDSKIKNVTACAGAQFYKDRWMDVPADREDEAKQNPYLITKPGSLADLVPKKTPKKTAKKKPDAGVSEPAQIAVEAESLANPSNAPVSDSADAKSESAPAKGRRTRKTKP